METSVAAILNRMDHWAVLDIGSEWFNAAQELANHDTAAAAKAYGWARVCYKLYDDAWRASAASRWDPDGSAEIAQAEAAIKAVQAAPPVTTALPQWATSLLEGVVPASAEDQPYLARLAKIAAEIRALS